MDDKRYKRTLIIILSFVSLMTIGITCFLIAELNKPTKNIHTAATFDKMPIDIQPASTIYANTDEIIDLSTHHFIATYEDKSESLIKTTDLIFSDNVYKPLKEGTNTITITYRNTHYTFDIIAKKKDPETNAEMAKRKYQTEYDNAEYKYASKSLFFAAKSYKNTKNDTYWLAHIVINDPSQINVNMAFDKYDTNRESPIDNAMRNKWLIGINASAFSTQTDQMNDTIYINNSTVYNNTATTGFELCITADGNMFTADANLFAEDLLRKNVIHTITSKTPTLIENGKAIDLTAYNNQSNKTAIGLIEPNDYYIIIASDNRYISDVSYEDIQSILLEKKCIYAKCVSGEANSFLAFDQKIINNPAVQPMLPLFDYITFSE